MSNKLIAGVAIGATAIGGLGFASGAVDLSKDADADYSYINTTVKNSSDYEYKYDKKSSHNFDHTYDLDCSSFDSRNIAQAAHDESKFIFDYDRHFLDGNEDGDACESFKY